MDQMEQLKKQLEAQNSTLENIEIEKLKLTQQVYENLEEIRLVTKENDDLKIMDEALRVQRDELRKSLQQLEASVSSHPALAGFRVIWGVGEWESVMATGMAGSLVFLNFVNSAFLYGILT